MLARVPARDAEAASGVLLTATQIGNALGVAMVGGAFTAAASLSSRDAFTISTLIGSILAGLTAVAAATLHRDARRSASGGREPTDAAD